MGSPAPAQTKVQLIGRSISRYRIIEKLGEGGMATVWKAEDTLLGRSVALKLLGPELRASDRGRRRFLFEARAAGSLDHPGICSVFDAGEAEGEVYIALACIDGRTVSALAERSPLALADVVHLGIAAADALGHAHAHGVVHRDVTGRNIMIGRDGRVFILDFGLALAAGASRLTTTGYRIGTLAYLSPEVAAGGKADARSDLYGLGVVLYEALTGTLPFESQRAEALLYSIVHEPPQPPTQRRRDTPADLDAIVMRLLAKAPGDRFPRAADLVAALRHLESTTPRTAPASWLSEPAEPGTPEHTRYLAVLPFQLGSEPADDRDGLVFGGMADVIATALARVPDLHVVPPALAAQEAATSNLQQVARQLGANLLLRTQVRRSGSHLRVTWSLLDAARGVQVGGETIEGQAADTFGLEDRLVGSVLNVLGCELPSRSKPPHDPAAHEKLLQAIGYLQRGEDEAAVDAAIGILQSLIASEGETVSLEAALGRAYWYKQRITHEARWESLAAAACERAMRIDPGSAEVLVVRGALAESSGQNARAEECYRAALALDPGRPDAMIGLGRALMAANQVEEAERTLRRCVEARPDYWDAHNALGRFYLRIGRYEEAVVEFERVLQLTPDNTRGLYNLSAALFPLERFEEALEACRRSIAIRPTPRSLTQLGSLLFYLGRYQEAAIEFERAVALQPSDAMLWGNLGSSCRFISGREHRTREALEHAIALGKGELDRNPSDAQRWSWMACWLANLERHAEARQAMERALGLEPANPNLMADACGVYHQGGDREQAFHWLRQALSHGFRPAQLLRDPHLSELRRDPEFHRILEQESNRSR